MKKKSISQILQSLLAVILMFFAIGTQSQEQSDTTRNKNIFLEFAGSGATLVTANFDMRFNKGRNDGLGMRLGLGAGTITYDYIIFEGSRKSDIITVPLELNYILGKSWFSFEIGYSVTYVFISENSELELLGEHYENYETGNAIVSYVPIGFRIKPEHDGFMFKLNAGPLFNFSAPNLFAEENTLFWAGIAVGYSFY